MIKVYAIAAALLLIIGGIWYAHHSGYNAGEAFGTAAVTADDAKAVAAAQQSQRDLASYAATAGTQLQTTINTALPTIQGQTNATVETIRTVYRDRPTTDVACSRPDGVQHSLDAAISSANAAASPDL